MVKYAVRLTVLTLLLASVVLAAEEPNAFSKGNSFLVKKEWKKAAVSYREAFAAHPTTVEGRQSLSLFVNIHVLLSKLDELIEAEEAAYRAGGDISSGRILIQCYRRDFETDKALDLCRTLLKAAPDDVALLEEYAHGLGIVERYAEGVETYHRLAKLNPSGKAGYFRAAAELRRGEGFYAGAEEEINKMLAAGGENTGVYKDAASLHGKMEGYRSTGRVLAMFEEAVRRNPSNVALMLELAERYEWQGYTNKAAKYTWEAVALSSHQQDSKFNRYDVAYELLASAGRLGASIENLTTKVRKDPGDIQSLTPLISLLMFNGDLLEALAHIEKVPNLVPDHPTLVIMRSAICERLEMEEEALKGYEAVLDLANVDRDAVLEKITKLRAAMGRREKAFEACGKILDPEKRAKAFIFIENEKEAENIYRALTIEHPLEKKYWEGLAGVLEKEEELQALRHVLVLDPDEYSAISRTAAICETLEQPERVVEAGKRILRMRDHWNDKETRRENVFVTALEFFKSHDLQDTYMGILEDLLKSKPRNVRMALDIRKMLGGAQNKRLLPMLASRVMAGDTKIDEKEAVLRDLVEFYKEPENHEDVMTGYKEKIEKRQRLEHDYDYLVYAALLKAEEEPVAERAVLDAGITAVKDSTPLRWRRVALYMKAKEYGKALEDLSWILENGAAKPVEEDIEADVERRLGNALYAVPVRYREIAADIDKRLLREAIERESRRGTLEKTWLAPPSEMQCVRMIGRAHYRLGNIQKAREVLKALHPGDETKSGDRKSLAVLYREEGDVEQAVRMAEEDVRFRAFIRNSASPVFHGAIWDHTYFYAGGYSGVEDFDRILLEHHLGRKEYLKAYDVMRTRYLLPDSTRGWGDNMHKSYRAFVSRYNIVDELLEFYRARYETALKEYRTFKETLKEAPGLREHFRAQFLRNKAMVEGYKLAEVYQGQNRFKDAAAVYKELHKLDPNDVSVLGCLRIIAMKEQDFDASIGYQDKIIAFYRDLASDPGSSRDTIHPNLYPFNPKSDRDDWDDAFQWGRHSYSMYYRNAWGTRQLRTEVAEAYQRQAATHIKAGDKDKAVQTMRSYVEFESDYPGMAWDHLNRFAGLCGMEDELFPIEGELAHRNPYAHYLVLSYASGLAYRKRYQEAIDLCLGLKARLGACRENEDFLKRVDKQLRELEQLTGRELIDDREFSAEGIREKAKKRPHDRRARVQLVKLLYTEGKFEEALKISEAIGTELGPDAENEAVQDQLLLALGKDDVWAGKGRRRYLERLRYHYEHDNTDQVLELCMKLGKREDEGSRMPAFRILESLGRYEEILDILKANNARKDVQASVLLRLGKDADALALYKQYMTTSNPGVYRASDYDPWRHPFWELFWQRGKMGLIEPLIEKAVADRPDSVNALTRKCAFAYFLGRPDLEAEGCRAILQRKPARADARRRLITLLNDREDFAGIEAQVRSALEADPSDTYRWMLGKCLLRRGLRKEAVECFRQFYEEGKPESAYRTAGILAREELFEEASAMFQLYMKSSPPPSSELYDFAVYMHLAAGDFTAAFDTAAKKLRLYPASIAPRRHTREEQFTPPLYAGTLYHLARATGKIDEYINLLKEIAAVDSSRVAYQLELAAAYLRENRIPEYEEWLKHLVKTFPRNGQLRGYLLAKYEKDEDWDRCLAAVADHTAHIPGDEYYWRMRRGRYHELRGDLKNAEDVFRSLVEDHRGAAAHMWFARWLAYHGRFEQSRAALERAMKEDTDNHFILLDYGLILTRLGKTDEAIHAYHRALKEDSWSSFQGNVGGAYRALRRLYGKSDFVQKAEDPYDIAIIKEVQGLEEEALAQYIRLHEKDPYNKKFLGKICLYLTRLGKRAETLPYREKMLRVIQCRLYNLGDEKYVRSFLRGTYKQAGRDEGHTAELKMAIGMIRYDADKDAGRALPYWRYSLEELPGSDSSWGRMTSEKFLLNRGLPRMAIDYSGRMVMPDRDERPVWLEYFDYLPVIAHLELGENDAAKELLSKYIRTPRGYRRTRHPYKGYEYYRGSEWEYELEGVFIEPGREISGFYAALEGLGALKQITTFLEERFAGHEGQGVNDTLFTLLTHHYYRVKNFARIEELIRAHYPERNRRQRDFKARELAALALEQGDRDKAAGHLKARLDDIDAEDRDRLRESVAEIFEQGDRSHQVQALALYRELDADKPHLRDDYMARRLLGVGESGLYLSSLGIDDDLPGIIDWRTMGDDIDWDFTEFDIDDTYHSEDVGLGDEREYPFNHRSGFPLVIDGDRMLRIVKNDARELGNSARRLIEREIGHGFDIVRLLLKLKQPGEAAALEKKLLSLSPKVLEGRVAPQAIRIYLLRRAAAAREGASDVRGCVDLLARAHALELELISASMETAKRRERALSGARFRHWERVMDLAQRAGWAEKYYEAFDSWRPLQEQECRKSRDYGLSGDEEMTAIIRRLVDVPSALMQEKRFKAAEELLRAVEDADTKEMKLLTAAVKVYRKQLKEAGDLCMQVVKELDEKQAEGERERWLSGQTGRLLKYEELPDALTELDRGDVLLIAHISKELGDGKMMRRAMKVAGDSDKGRKHFRWAEITPPSTD